MRNLLIFFFIVPLFCSAQNFPALGDSCFRIKDYTCSGTNFDLFLSKIDSESNDMAYRSALSWGLAGNKSKTLNSVKVYIRNNYLNGVKIFSKKLTDEKVFNFLLGETEWNVLLNKVRAIEKQIMDSILNIVRLNQEMQKRLEKSNMHFDSSKDAKSLYKSIQVYNNFPTINERYLSLTLPLMDSLHMAYLVVLPNNYNPKRTYPVLFFLHGAVAFNTGYPLNADTAIIGGWNRFYTKYADQNQIIMVYPHANNEYNWMYPDKGFFMVPAILKQMKAIINIDDDRVFITGHSNGATGSFSYLMKKPSPFAGFYGFNTRPIVVTGGTYLRNIMNRSYFNVSTDNDYYYPPDANDSLHALMNKMGADYNDHRYNGFPHWFPQFNESEEAHRLLFDDLITRKRNLFQKEIYWECDDIKYNRCDWLTIESLDTMANRANWHVNLNFPILKWKLASGRTVEERDTSLNAFTYFKKSGAVKASYHDNIFELITSCVESVSIYISPEMVNPKKAVRVIVNGIERYNSIVSYRKDVLWNEFVSTNDRKALYIDKIYIDKIK